MDTRFSAATGVDDERSVAVAVYPVGTPIADVVAGTAPSALDLSPHATRVQQSTGELTVSLAWHHELYGVAQPTPGQVLAVCVDGVLLAATLIESLNDYRLASGERRLTLTARSPEAFAAWREVKRVTDIYPLGTRLDQIARDIALDAGLAPAEIALPPILYAVPHSNLQLANLAAWDMLETLLLPAGLAPWIDGCGRLRAMSRDLARGADVALTDDRLVAVTRGRAAVPLSSLRLAWQDPDFTEVVQQDQSLASANITAGFFQMRQEQDVYWSDDRTQRARNTRLVIKQSANSGLFPVCSEDYSATAHTGGRITLETAAWVPGLMGVFLATKAAGLIPDIAPPFGGPTTPVGKAVHAALELSVLLTMASIGTGSYEVWGTPYDYVHARHTTEAYDSAAPAWLDKVESIESDLVQNDAHAQAFAARELIYRAHAAQRYGVTIVDDLRLEPGDILALPDGSRLYVTGLSRNLARDAPACLEVEGFVA